MVELRLPKFGVGMEVARLSGWLVGDGDAVRRGDPVATIESEKSEIEIEAPADGVIRLHADAGGEFAVGTLLATVQSPSASAAPPKSPTSGKD